MNGYHDDFSVFPLEDPERTPIPYNFQTNFLSEHSPYFQPWNDSPSFNMQFNETQAYSSNDPFFPPFHDEPYLFQHLPFQLRQPMESEEDKLAGIAKKIATLCKTNTRLSKKIESTLSFLMCIESGVSMSPPSPVYPELPIIPSQPSE